MANSEESTAVTRNGCCLDEPTTTELNILKLGNVRTTNEKEPTSFPIHFFSNMYVIIIIINRSVLNNTECENTFEKSRKNLKNDSKITECLQLIIAAICVETCMLFDHQEKARLKRKIRRKRLENAAGKHLKKLTFEKLTIKIN